MFSIRQRKYYHLLLLITVFLFSVVSISNLFLTNDKKTQELNKQCRKILKNVEDQTPYQKIVYFHDYIIKNCEYSLSDTPTSAYDALVGKKAASDGYSKAYQLLLTLSNIDNELVYAESNINPNHVHYFNKVLLDNEWYDVDVSVDDPISNNTKDTFIKRTYLLVTDDVLQQRYIWDKSKYPAAITKNNWYMRNNLVANNQKELEILVIKAIENKEEYVSIWIDDFSSNRYNFSFIKQNKAIKNSSISFIGNSQSAQASSISTAIDIKLEYANK